MKRLLKRITGFILLITIMTSAIGPTVFAAQKNDVKTNFKYEVGNIEDLDSAPLARSTKPIEIIYTYTQNGENFRVYNEISTDLNHGYAEVYKLLGNQEILVRTEKADSVDGVVTTEITENGITTVDVLDLRKDVFDNGPITIGTWDGWPVSDTYEEWGTFRHSVSIVGATVAAVTAAINTIVKATKIPTPGKVTVTVISAIVNYIVQNSISKTYVEEDVAYRWTQIPTAAVQQQAVERTIRTFYTDSNYATVIDEVTTYVYSQWYED